ncbi:hypothetical protein DV736_g3450, partial [Chaetothyriales sp. CBS 134916]
MAIPKAPTKESHPELYEEIQKHELTDWEKTALERCQWPSQTHQSWIYEKIHDWDDYKNYTWTQDEILTWVSIYQFSCPGPSASRRIYYEESHSATNIFEFAARYIDVPLGITLAPKELGPLPILWHKTMGPIVFGKVWEIGGLLQHAENDYEPFPEFLYLGEDIADGLLAWIQIGINQSADYTNDSYYNIAAYLEADGGYANSNSGSLGGALGGNWTSLNSTAT